MSRAPAVVLVVRHGARLDAADKKWHFTSPTPYDPPLTYGGWVQARTLGTRIATILQAREDLQREPGLDRTELTESEFETQPRRKKQKVIIHSSPFVRCVQTAIAISAGLAMQRTDLPNTRRPSTQFLKNRSPSLSSIPEPPDDTFDALPTTIPPPQKFRTTQLRIDAFLGEWLSPDYFDQITPPPSSVMMVAGAKAELLRPGDKIEGTEGNEKNTHGNFPGGWRSSLGDSASIEEEDSESDGSGLSTLSTLANALPRSRSSTHSSGGRPAPKVSRILTSVNGSLAYAPPTPTYAISSSDSIPAGYVAHARDACVDVNYRWDSMRAPQDWGNGGEYGEEWSSMHKRFRNGLQKMIGWYKEQDFEMEDEDTDIVLILVTHGAGCNALIGALTNQPVLLDVGMASLTMAVRRELTASGQTDQPASSRQSRRSSIIDGGIAEEYDVKLLASTDHLRGSTPVTPSIGPSPRSSTPLRKNFSPLSSVESISDDTFKPASSQGLYRSSSGAYRPRAATSTIRQSSGLWGSTVSNDTASESSDSDFMPNFGNATANPAEILAADAVKRAEMTNADSRVVSTPHIPSRTASQRGLWGGPSNGYGRDSPSKRRWTVNEQNG